MTQKNMKEIIVLLIGFVLSLIASFLPILELYRIIVVLLLYVATLVWFFVYLAKRPKEHVEHIPADKSEIHLITGRRYDIKMAVKKAKQSVFISGITLSRLYEFRDLFMNDIHKDIRLELIMFNINNTSLLKNYCDMVKGRNTPENLKTEYQNSLILLNQLRNREKTYIKYVDFIMPIAYVGIDIEREGPSSKIKSQHYIRDIYEGEDSLGFEAEAGTKLFHIYKRQIEFISAQSTELDLSNPN